MHNTVEGFIGDLQGKCLTQPALDVEVTRKARGRRQARFELLEHDRREGLLARWRSRFFGGPQGVQPAVPIAAKPDGDGIPVQGQMRGGLAAGGHLVRFEPDSQRQPGFALGIALATELFFEDSEVFSNRR